MSEKPEPTCPKESLRGIIAFDSRDWSINKRDAWIYGIVIGWGNSVFEVGEQHGWDLETTKRLLQLHKDFCALANKPPSTNQKGKDQ